MHSHHHHAPGVWHHRTTTTLECCKSRRTSSARRQDYFFLRSPLRIGCSHSSTTSSIFNDIYRDDETFSKDASRRVAMREAEMKPDTYKHPDDSFYGEIIDADSVLLFSCTPQFFLLRRYYTRRRRRCRGSSSLTRRRGDVSRFISRESYRRRRREVTFCVLR